MTDHTYLWSQLRERAAQSFGELPHNALEQDCIDIFEIMPAVVAKTLEGVIDDYAAGKIRSGWPILRSRLQGARDKTEIVANDASQREREIRKAKAWIFNAGIYIDREDELTAELFDDSSGRLRHFDTPTLRNEMTDLWKQQRPRGERAEQASLEWDETCRKSLAVMRAYRAGKLTAEPATLGTVAEDTRKP